MESKWWSVNVGSVLSTDTGNIAPSDFQLFFNSQEHLFITISNAIMLPVAIVVSQIMVHRYANGKGDISDETDFNITPKILGTLITSIILILMLLNGFFLLVAIPFMPFMGMFVALSFRQKHNSLPFKQTSGYIKKGFGKLLLLCMALGFLLIITNMLFQFVGSEIITAFIMNYLGSGKYFYMTNIMLTNFLNTSLIFTFWTTFFTTCGLSYFGFREIYTAEILKSRILSDFPMDTLDKKATATLLNKSRFNKA